jgi:copper chaperone NosL
MKNIVVAILLCLVVGVTASFAADQVESPPACQKCGMNRTSFAQSRMLIVYADGTTVGTCSLHCAAIALGEGHGRQVTSITVADYTTKKLIDANTAVWVIGGKKQGVMTKVAKWAFANKGNAESFVKENGGKVATYQEALKLAEEESPRHKH